MAIKPKHISLQPMGINLSTEQSWFDGTSFVGAYDYRENNETNNIGGIQNNVNYKTYNSIQQYI